MLLTLTIDFVSGGQTMQQAVSMVPALASFAPPVVTQVVAPLLTTTATGQLITFRGTGFGPQYRNSAPTGPANCHFNGVSLCAPLVTWTNRNINGITMNTYTCTQTASASSRYSLWQGRQWAALDTFYECPRPRAAAQISCGPFKWRGKPFLRAPAKPSAT